MDLGKKQGRNYAPLAVNELKYLGVHTTEGLTWVLYIDSVVRKAWQDCFTSDT